MPFTQRALDDKPVLISTFTGEITIEDFQAWNQATQAWVARQMVDRTYIIFDAREAETSFGTIMKQMNMVRSLSFRTATGSDQGELMFVGGGAMVKLVLSLFNTPQFGNQHIPVFPTIEDALAYVDQALLQNKKTPSV